MAGEAAVYPAIVTILEGLGVFADVLSGSVWPQTGRMSCPAAMVRPISETELLAGGADNLYDVTATYELAICVQEQDETARRAELRRLAALAQNALTNVSLASITKPTLTRLGTVRHESRPTHPYERIYLTGTFQYETTATNRDVTEA